MRRTSRRRSAGLISEDADRLAAVLSDEEASRTTISYALRELIRNAMEHSDADSVWYAAQSWPKLDEVERNRVLF